MMSLAEFLLDAAVAAAIVVPLWAAVTWFFTRERRNGRT